MSIVAQCPHCHTRFNLQPKMNGKSIRCPNLECRQVFSVKAMEEKGPAPSYELPPEPAPAPKPPKPSKPAVSKPPAPAKPPKPTRVPVKPAVVDAVVVEAAVVSPPKVKEVVWSEGTEVPPPPKKRKSAESDERDESTEPDESPDDLPVRRKRKHSRGPLLLAVMVVGIVAALGFAAFYIIYFQGESEKRLAAQAKDEYDKASYADAAKTYEKLTQEYAGSKDVDKYKFFADLAAMQTIVRGVTNREDYDAAVKRLNEFVAAQKESPLSKPGSGFGRDVLEAGKQLGEAVADHAEDRVKAYQADNAKSGELTRADKAVAAGRELIATLDPFRGADDPPLDGLKAKLDRAEQGVKRERDRTAALARAREQLGSPTDALIQTVEAELAAAGLAGDTEAQKIVGEAKGKLRDLVKYEEDRADPQPPPPSAAASLLFVTPVGKTKAREPAPNDPPSTVFLCVSRGILYALDEDNGALLWAARVGPDVVDPPAVARVELANGPTDLAVVTSNVGGAPAVAGQVLRTGATRWYQPLPASAAGPAVVVGGRAFVPVRDPVGTVFEFDLTSGARVGKIRLGQPVADRSAVLRPGTNLIYVAADARRLYVLDVGGKDDDGNRVNLRCAQVIATGHLSGTVRVAPLFIGPEGTEPADRWMVLAQSEGTSRTLLRAFAVGPLPPPTADGAAVPETPAAHAVALPVPGWISYPPVCDGERLAVVSDTGRFRLFGVNQPGNADKTLFPFPGPAGEPPPGERTVPGLVIPLAESTYWVLAAGRLQRARLSLHASKGQSVVFAGEPVPVGEPVHGGQLNARKDVACVVVRSPNSAGVRAIAFDVRAGEMRWQRQLGIVPAKLSADRPAPPIAQGDKFILIDEDGGIVAVPAASGVAVGQTVPAAPAWVLASAPPDATGPTLVAPAPDGKTVYALTPVSREGPKFVVRRVADGKLAHEDEAVAPAAVAGQPAVVGGSLLIPTADGFVNRLVPGDGRVRPGTLVAGPPWLGERKPAHAVCCITPLTDSTFATSDGGKKVSRWDWPAGAGGKWSLANTWDVRQEVTGAGVVLPPAAAGDPPRLAVADTSGSVWLFAADRAGPQLRRWKPGEAGVPAGKPTSALAAQAATGRVVVAYAVDGKSAAAIDPDAGEALWTAKTGDDASSALVGAPQPAGDDRWVLTDLAGRVVAIDGATGAVLATQSVGLPGAVPAAPSGAVANAALAPLSDGSAVVIELPKRDPFVPPKKE